MVNAIARTIPTVNLAGFGFGAMYPSWYPPGLPDFRGANRGDCVNYLTDLNYFDGNNKGPLENFRHSTSSAEHAQNDRQYQPS
jgi:hypothetical protein